MKKTTFSAAISLILCVASCSSDDPTMSNFINGIKCSHNKKTQEI